MPLPREGEPGEVAHATLALVLPAASYVNGAMLVVDGGLMAQKNTQARGDRSSSGQLPAATRPACS